MQDDDGIKQYTLSQILLIWAAVTLPMGLAYWVLTPAIADGPFETIITATILLTLGLIWQFVLSMILLYREQGSVGIDAMARGLWLRLPRHPRTGVPSVVIFLVVVPIVCAFFIINILYLSEPILKVWTGLLPFLKPLPYQEGAALFSPEVAPMLEGAWWFLALFMVLSLFNVFLGEEFLFRGILLPRMSGVFGRFDWVMNGVLFGLYHVHQPWDTAGIMLLGGISLSLAPRLFKSIWLGIIPHSIQTVIVFVMILGLVSGNS